MDHSISPLKEGSSTAVTESVPSSVTIQPGDTFMYTFATLINMAVSNQDSIFELEGWVSLANDSDPSNDTAQGQIESWYTPNAPLASGTSVTYGNSASLNCQLKWKWR